MKKKKEKKHAFITGNLPGFVDYILFMFILRYPLYIYIYDILDIYINDILDIYQIYDKWNICNRKMNNK